MCWHILFVSLIHQLVFFSFINCNCNVVLLIQIVRMMGLNINLKAKVGYIHY